MIKKLFRGTFIILGIMLGYVVSQILLGIPQLANLNYLSSTVGIVTFIVLLCCIFGIILYLISPMIYKEISNLIEYTEKNMQKLSITEILYGAVGAIIALVITFFIAKPINNFRIVGPTLFTLLNLLVAIIGANIMIKKKEDITSLLLNIRKATPREKRIKEVQKEISSDTNYVSGIPKVLDTSVIIDGRIFDICETGFIEGPLIIPNFVLDELRHISDSSDALKRQKELVIETRIVDDDFPKIAEVDSKLLKLAQKMNGKVLTNDYNLNKVAEFQGVPVLNINELSNAIKQVVLPGEEMTIDIIKDGKESSQGVAYLDDGTMIVVEGGKKYIGETKTVIVTSVLQTAAGRMIFAKAKDDN